MCNNLRKISVACALWLLAILTPLVQAQGLIAEHFAFRVGNWQLNQLEGVNGEFMGFWAIPQSALSVGHIRRLWFQPVGSDEWAVWAFEPKNANAFAAQRHAEGMSDDSLAFFYSRERQAAQFQPDQAIDGGAEGLIENGLIIGDPLVQTLSAMPDPTPMIDLLADVGYPVAPGMTQMLITPGAGTQVNMNPTTKQLLDCLRSTSSACGGCVCVEAEGPIQRSDWTVYQTNMAPPDQSIRCDYSRVINHSYWQTGEYPDDCSDCTIGSPDEPATWTELEEYTDFWLDETECPDEPILPRP